MDEKRNEEKKGNGMFALLPQLFQKKNRLFLLGLAGILLIFLSDTLLKPREEGKKVVEASVQSAANVDTYVQDLEKRLTQMIVNVQGAGKTAVMITLDTSGETVYARNEKNDTETQSAESGVQSHKSSYQSEYTLMDSGGEDTPIVETQLLPEIKGVAVICEGGEDITVVSRVTELVSVVLGLSTNRICVTKMI